MHVPTPASIGAATGSERGSLCQHFSTICRSKLILATLVTLLALISLCSVVLLHYHAQGKLSMTWQRRPLREMQHEQGKAYWSDLHREWMSAHQEPSPALVLENGVPLGPGNVLHQKIRDDGNGQFCFWHAMVLFSASDNSDPRTNQKTYEICWPVPVPRTVQWGLPLLAIMLSFAASYLIVTGILPVGRSWLSPIAKRWTELRDRFLGNPSFALASAVFAIVLTLQVVNFGLHFRDPEMARSGYSIFGVPFNDARGWFNQGASLACGQGMSGRWPGIRPGYGLFLALFFTWSGPSYLLAAGLNLVLAALTAALLCQLGERLIGRWVGFIAALGFATQNLTLTYPLTLGTESLGLFCTVLTLHQLMDGIETGKRRSFLIAGVFLGLSNLVRPLTLPAFPLYLLGIVCGRGRTPHWRPVFVRAAVFTAGLFLAIAPWLVRQSMAFGIVTISDNTSEVLYAAMNPRYGSWTSEIYHEPDFKAMGVKERYDHFMKKARASFRAHPGFYFSNVVHSYVACFQNLSRSARSRLSLLGFFVILGFHCSWSAQCRLGPRQAWVATALGVAAVGFAFACRSAGASLDLIVLLLLPLVARRGPALIHVLGLIGTILGIALFGMGDPDPRLRFVIEWGFLLSALAFVHGCCARAVWFFERAGEPDATSLTVGDVVPASDQSRTPPWFVLLRAAFVGFVLVSSVRVAALTAMTAVPPNRPRFLTHEEAVRVAQAFDLHSPGLLHSTDLQPEQILCHVGSLDRLRVRELEKELSCSHNKILILPVRVIDYKYYLPKNKALPHWSRYFTARDYDRTICYFQVDGIPTPKYGDPYIPVLFPGFLPRRLYETDAVLICRIHFDSAYRATDERLLFEGIALIPTDETRILHLDGAYYPTHPHHPGSYPVGY